jgi:type II secretory pathway pseudopilin PulG
LAAVALPNLLGQIGKARETEAKTTIGAVNKAQQAFHFERQTFANTVDLTAADNPLGVVIEVDDDAYYDYDVTGSLTTGDVEATAKSAAEDGVRQYAGSVGFEAGAYTSVLCQSDTIGGGATATGGGCTAGTKIK